MATPDNPNSILGSRNLLVSASSLLLLWNLVGIDQRVFESGPLRPLSAIPKGVVPIVLIFYVVYESYVVFRDSRLSPPSSDKAFLLGVDMAIAYIIAASAVLSYFSHLTGAELISAIRMSPTCLVFAGFGWALVLPSAYALLRSRSQVLSDQGLTIMGPVMLGCGVLAIWIASSIASNLWPAWVGIWAGLIPGIVVILGWRLR